jgi:hypothetical protein
MTTTPDRPVMVSDILRLADALDGIGTGKPLPPSDAIRATFPPADADEGWRGRCYINRVEYGKVYIVYRPDGIDTKGFVYLTPFGWKVSLAHFLTLQEYFPTESAARAALAAAPPPPGVAADPAPVAADDGIGVRALIAAEQLRDHYWRLWGKDGRAIPSDGDRFGVGLDGNVFKNEAKNRLETFARSELDRARSGKS